jgi:hypothetical protein
MLTEELKKAAEDFKIEKNCKFVAVVNNGKQILPLYNNEQIVFVERYIMKQKLKLFVQILKDVIELKQDDISSIKKEYENRVQELNIVD